MQVLLSYRFPVDKCLFALDYNCTISRITSVMYAWDSKELYWLFEMAATESRFRNEDFFTACPILYVLIHYHILYDHEFGGTIQVNREV